MTNQTHPDSFNKISLFKTISGLSRTQGFAFLTLGVILVLRLLTLSHLPYLDASESRYALVGKIMSEDGDVFTPKVYLQGEITPFFSKPPLHFWMEAAAIKVFGMNEVSVRLPSYFMAVLMLAITFYTAFRIKDIEAGLIAGATLFTCGLFFYMAGSTLVDMTLSAALTGVMASFLLSQQESLGREKKIWGYLFFAFLAMGMLTKGPIALIFPGASIVLWSFLAKDWVPLKNLPWVKGAAVFICLTVPTFLVEEYHNPGFLRYFFINENVLRYLVKDYGDKFGSGHRYPYGSSWLFLLAIFCPWTLLFIPALTKFIRNGFRQDKRLLYFIAWGFAPAIFLTFARQILGTYLMPSLGGLSIFLALIYSELIAGLRANTISNCFRIGVFVLLLSYAALTMWCIAHGIPSEHLLTAVIIVSMLFAVFQFLKRDNQYLPQFIAACFGLTIFYTGVTLDLCVYAKQYASTEALMEKIDSRYEIGNPRIYFPFGVPNSAYLYKDTHEVIVDGLGGSPLNANDNKTLIVIRDKQVKDFTKRFGSNFNELLRVGKWIVFHQEGHQGSCEDVIIKVQGNSSLNGSFSLSQRDHIRPLIFNG